MKEIVIIGAGGLGKEVCWLIENINNNSPTWNILGFIENESKTHLFGQHVYGYEVLGENEWLLNNKHDIHVAIAVAKSSNRKSIYERFSKYPWLKIVTLIDPSVRIDTSVSIGDGTVICRNCSITVDTVIGKGTLLNIGALIGHDAKVGDFCTFAPHSIAAGETTFGECCEVGSGAFILQGKNIAENTVIAPLSAVYHDINEAGVYAGNPARKIK